MSRTSYIQQTVGENHLLHYFHCILELRATDYDEGRNSAVKYKTMYEPDAELFHVNPVSGLVTAKVSFNYEQQMYYEVCHIE